MIVLNTGSLEISEVHFTCKENENNKVAYPILFKTSNEIKDIEFDKVTSSYSAILYIASDNNDEIIFNNLTFNECKCKDYIIDVFVSKVIFSKCDIIFSETPDKKCGGIRINNKYGEINIENSKFLNTQSETGTIYYKPISSADETSTTKATVTILGSEFDHCKGGFYIDSESNLNDEFNIIETKFYECYSISSNNKFSIGCNSNNNNNQITIQRCEFHDCSNPTSPSGCIILIESNSEPPSSSEPPSLTFEYNTVDFTNTNSRGCIALKLLQRGCNVIIHNNSFTKCYRPDDEARDPWPNTISTNLLNMLTISESQFYKCGCSEIESNTNGGGNVIGILGDEETDINIRNCTFDTTSTPVSTFCEKIKFVGNNLINCGRNSFQVTHKVGSEGFELIENRFIGNSKGCVIHTWVGNGCTDIQHSPIIERNTFEDISVPSYGDTESDYFVIFQLNVIKSVLFENNTFRNIQTYLGGFAGKFEVANGDDINLTFSNCFFENNVQSTNGGAFCSTNNYNGGDISLTFNECFFTDNKAEGNGGALFIDTNRDVNILGCHFISNTATSNSDNTGLGGAIYINKVQGELTISGCEFKSNYASEGQAIYFIDILDQFILTQTDFNNNVNLAEGFNDQTPQYMIVFEIGSFSISDVYFSCEGTGIISYPILFKSSHIIENIEFTNVTSTYSPILYITKSEGYESIKFDNLTFTDCKYKENYVIEVVDLTEIEFSQTHIIFSNIAESYGGIKIDQPGNIQITKSIFKRTNINTGCIYYNPTILGTTANTFTIQESLFEECNGGCCYISTQQQSIENIKIVETTFLKCSNWETIQPGQSYGNGFTTIGISSSTDSINMNVEDCKFENSGCYISSIHIISLVSEENSNPSSESSIIIFENNTFESEKSEDSCASLNLIMNKRKVLIHKCSFMRSTINFGIDPWANCIRAILLTTLDISECYFYKCGNIGDDTDLGNVIGVGVSEGSYTAVATECHVENCTFNFTSTTISSYSESVTFKGNTLYKVGPSSFRIRIVASNGVGFEFTDNIITDSDKGVIINCWESYGNDGLKHSPTIRNNTFEHISTVYPERGGDYDEQIYAFQFKVNGDVPIVFDNNTFRDIRTCYGGFGGSFTQLLSTVRNIDLTFTNCYFEYNKQIKEVDGNGNEQFSNDGGAFKMTNNYNSGNIQVRFEECYFNNNEAREGRGGALFLSSNDEIQLERCEFNSNKASEGGAIYISEIVEEGKLTINECKFNENLATTEGQAIYGTNSLNQFILANTNFVNNLNTEITNSEQYMIVLTTDKIDISHVEFESNSNQISYPILFKGISLISNLEFNDVNSTNSALLVIPSYQNENNFDNVSFINCYSKDYIIHTRGDLSYSNSKILFDEHSDIKAFRLEQGENIQLNNIQIINCGGGVFVDENIKDSSIDNCYFMDCYNSGNDNFVVIISNQKCVFSNNIINFTTNEQSMKGIKVTKHGQISIINNQILRTKGDSAFYMTDSEGDGLNSESVIFNYNTIEECANVKNGIFNIQKCYDFNIDHNIIKNCIIHNYASNIDMQKSKSSGKLFKWTNLTSIGCESHSQTGGGLGLLLTFEGNEGTFTLEDCYFERNKAGTIKSTGNDAQGFGGAFSAGYSSTGNMELFVNNCQFINNQSPNKGGALSIQSGRPAQIYNCSFIGNTATNGGAAIYIYPYKGKNDFLPQCNITKCIFENNQDQSNKGHAIYFEYNNNCQTILTIDQNCYFKDNGNETCQGNTISIDSPYFTISDSIIEFTSSIKSTSGLLIQSNNINSTINNCQFINTVGETFGAVQTIVQNNHNQLSMQDCTFDNCAGNNAPTFILSSYYQILFERNTIKNCIYQQNLGKISITEARTQPISQIISGSKFIDNSQTSSDESYNETSGLLIEGTNSQILIKYEFCEFERNNVTTGCGGSICICSRLPTSKPNLLLEINNCTFRNNSAPYNGGALYISMMYTVTIYGSEFYDNNCGRYGGALYIGYEDSLINYAYDSNEYLVIENCVFVNCISSTDGGGIFLKIESSNGISIHSCIFNRCRCNNNNQCFNISVLYEITFKNNTIKNTISSGNSYFGQIKSSNGIVFDEITFVNNVCNSMFGGGSGMMILSEKIVFNGCKFINNTATQITNSNEQRPQPDGMDSAYYNGDGGGIQIGYSSSTSTTELEFINCNFTNNKATRHGGAIAIQTLKTVNIFDCIFESNTADNRETSSSLLLYENHFDKKKEGRGGAIYINPTFSFHEEDVIYPPDNDHMKKVDIKNCKFIMNKAFDGFAIYIEGDEPKNNFEISIHNNEFKNNNQINGEDDINKTCRALIASEVLFEFNKTINENIFIPSTNISYVDHYGNLIHIIEIVSKYEITSTKFFTNSNEFTSTKYFTISNEFTNSETMLNNIVNLPASKPQATRKITYSKSYSLTYVSRRSVSFSLSFVSSNLYEMSYDSIKETYSMFLSQTNYQSYFPYIIYYMSPLYVERTVIIDITSKRRISPEQLIGVVCGAASVFFLVLGIIILAVRKHNEIKNQYDEFDDLSYSTEAEIRENVKEGNETNINDYHDSNLSEF